jgi:histidine triad (HIT) family protein
MEDDCVFCKIISGLSERDKIWEDDDFVAFLDINPCARGHLLVVPRKHSRWVWDMDGGEYLKYMGKVRYLAGVLRKAFDTDCVQGAIVGMDVSHSHVHLLPRVEGDGLGGLPTTPMEPKPSVEEIKEITGKIKGAIEKKV